MTKPLVISAVLLSLVLVPHSAFASRWEMSLAAGPAFPGPDFVLRSNADPVKATGAAYSLAADVGPRYGWRVGLDGSLVYMQGPTAVFQPKHQDRYRTLHWGVHAKYRHAIGGAFGAHALLGFGAYRTTEDFVQDGYCSIEQAYCEQLKESTSTGFHAGAKAALGASLKMSPASSLLMDVEYNAFQVPDEKFASNSLSYLGVLLGLSFGAGE